MIHSSPNPFTDRVLPGKDAKTQSFPRYVEAFLSSFARLNRVIYFAGSKTP